MKKICLIPFARFQAVIFALLGVLAGLIYAVGGLIYDLASASTPNTGTTLAFLALTGMPILLALAGLLCGLVGGWIFNRFSGALNKFQLDLDILEN